MRGDTMFSDTVRMEISRAYNLYNEGTITLEQRESMIQEAKDQEYRESVFDIDSIDPYLSPTEQLQEIKKLCYEKCAAGEISVFERERLVNEYSEAYKDKIYTEAVTARQSASVDNDTATALLVSAGAVIAGFKAITHTMFVAKRANLFTKYPELRDCANRIKSLQSIIKKEYKALKSKNRKLSMAYSKNYQKLQVDTKNVRLGTDYDGNLTVQVDNDYSVVDRDDLSKSEKKQKWQDTAELAEVQRSMKKLQESINELKFLNKKLTRIVKKAIKEKKDIPEQDIVELRKSVERCEKIHFNAKKKGRV